ncbi:helix-turn-helix domain-containing protein [Acrocarpospora catenulata]|uniref:helix-turn-helix domain-containing protein n=1 Tax=Acrocarpospora catenulata TaxID=2836182 RepID=UPI001BD91563|nr:helix-turn-helix transcriptional regulator [Acrocarpospora catenulata]
MGNNAGQFGAWLREQLTERGYLLERGGQTRFATEAGIGVSVLSRTLSGDRVPEIDALRGIGRVLGYGLGEMLVIAGVATADELPVRHAATHDEVIADLRRDAAAEGKSIGEVLLERGVDANQLIIPDAPPTDPHILEIEALDIPQDAKVKMIRIYLENRALRFEEARRRREQE